MAVFVVEIAFGGDQEARRRCHAAHRAYWEQLADRGVLISGGLWRDGQGEMLLCAVADPATLQRLVAADPVMRANAVSDVRIREWRQALGADLVATGRDPEPTPAAHTSDPADPPAAELTPHEHRVATLAVEGKTNREIAELLRVSPRAVEMHLTKAYRKLGIRRRVELVTAIR